MSRRLNILGQIKKLCLWMNFALNQSQTAYLLCTFLYVTKINIAEMKSVVVVITIFSAPMYRDDIQLLLEVVKECI